MPMFHINKHGIGHGVWKHKGTGEMIVVIEIVTHRFVGGAQEKMEQPMVVYRDLMLGIDFPVYSIGLIEFKLKFETNPTL